MRADRPPRHFSSPLSRFEQQFGAASSGDPRVFIAPDLPAMPAYADWLAHRDPALAAIDAWRPTGEPEVPPNMHWGSRRKLEAKPPAIAW